MSVTFILMWGVVKKAVWCGYEVPGINLLCDLMRAMWLDCNKDTSMHIFSLHHVQFQCINASCVEAVVLVRRVWFYVS